MNKSTKTKPKLDLLYINHNSTRTGTFLRCMGFGRVLSKLGHRVTILTTANNKILRNRNIEENVKVIEFPDLLVGNLRNGFCPYNTINRILYLRSQSYDLIHAFDSRPVVIFPALYLSKLKKTPLVMDWADWWGRGGTIKDRSNRLFQYTFEPIETFFEESFRRYADAATVISSALRVRLSSLGFDERKILLLYQGCDIDGARPLDKNKCREDLGIDFDSKIIGYLGTLLPGDAPLLFEVFGRLTKRIADLKLYLIGNTKLNPDRYIKNHDAIVRTGFVEKEMKNKYIGACDVMILPLKNSVASNGRWPSKINDYMAAAKPIVSTPISDLRNIFEDQKIGLLADDDPEVFSNIVEKLLEDDDLKVKLGEKARAYARTFLDWEILAKKLEEFYFQTINLGNGKARFNKIKEVQN